MKKIVGIMLLAGALTTPALAQREKGKTLKTPTIFSKERKTEKGATDSGQPLAKPQLDDMDFKLEEQPNLRFTNSYSESAVKEVPAPAGTTTNGEGIHIIKVEPIRTVNTLVQDDTSSIDEGEIQLVEIEEMAQFEGSDELVQVASYYSIWDTRSVNPYGINPLEFEEVVPIRLYDLTQGRYWASPLDKSPITSHFGWRHRRWHKGTDLDLETGDPVYTTFDGIVRVAGTQSGWGRTVLVRHYNGLETLYGHLSRIDVEPNTIIKAGDKIGLGGNSGRSSGSHLHYEVRYEGNAFDPENIFRFSKEEGKTEVMTQDFMMGPEMYNYLRGGRSRPQNTTEEVETVSDDEEFSEEDERPVTTVKYAWTTVKRGDTLFSIAQRNHTTVDELCKINRIRSSHRIYAGMRLRIK